MFIATFTLDVPQSDALAVYGAIVNSVAHGSSECYYDEDGGRLHVDMELGALNQTAARSIISAFSRSLGVGIDDLAITEVQAEEPSA